MSPVEYYAVLKREEGLTPATRMNLENILPSEISQLPKKKKNLIPLLLLLITSVSFFCDLMGCSPPGSSVHGILQARILEWVTMPSSRGSS